MKREQKESTQIGGTDLAIELTAREEFGRNLKEFCS